MLGIRLSSLSFLLEDIVGLHPLVRCGGSGCWVPLLESSAPSVVETLGEPSVAVEADLVTVVVTLDGPSVVVEAVVA